MTVIRGLSPLMQIKSFQFGRLHVRVVDGWQFYMLGSETFSTLEFVVYEGYPAQAGVLQYTKAVLGNNTFELPLAVAFDYTVLLQPNHPNNPWRTEQTVCVVNYDGSVLVGFYLQNFSKLHLCSIVTQSEYSPMVISPGAVLYDPMPDVLANLNHFGQRLEVWHEVRVSDGSREWTLLFRSAPAVQVSIAPLQDAGWVDEQGFIVNLPSQGLPVFGRNTPGPYSPIDTYTGKN